MRFNDIATEIAKDKEAKEAAKNAASINLKEMLDNTCELIEAHMTFDPDTMKVSAFIDRKDVPQEFWDKFEYNGLTFKTRLPFILNERMYHARLKMVTNSLHYDKDETEEYVWFSFQVEELYI